LIYKPMPKSSIWGFLAQIVDLVAIENPYSENAKSKAIQSFQKSRGFGHLTV
jgi:hypothetical protein